jgi:hypothetical protein
MPVAAFRLLPHFGDPAESASPATHAPGFRPLVEPAFVPAPAPDVSATERAVAAALEEARQDFEMQRAADRAEHERLLAAREAEIHEIAAQAMADQLTAGLAELNTAIATHVSRVLLRFLEKRLRERAVGELSETVASLLHGGEAVRVRVSGPADLVDRLGAAVGHVATVEVEVSDVPDVTVVIDNTTIETRIGAWMDRAQRAVAGGNDE